MLCIRSLIRTAQSSRSWLTGSMAVAFLASGGCDHPFVARDLNWTYQPEQGQEVTLLVAGLSNSELHRVELMNSQERAKLEEHAKQHWADRYTLFKVEPTASNPSVVVLGESAPLWTKLRSAKDPHTGEAVTNLVLIVADVNWDTSKPEQWHNSYVAAPDDTVGVDVHAIDYVWQRGTGVIRVGQSATAKPN